jgi:hypothetical protein
MMKLATDSQGAAAAMEVMASGWSRDCQPRIQRRSSASRTARRAARAGAGVLAVAVLAAACAGGSGTGGSATTTAAPAVTLPLEQAVLPTPAFPVTAKAGTAGGPSGAVAASTSCASIT